MMQRVSAILFVLLAACLVVGGCEGEKAAEEEKSGQTAGEGAEAAGPEEEMLKAMKEVADILKANMEDPDKALTAAREYHTKNEAALKKSMEAVKAKDASLNAEEQEAFWTKVTDRPEYKAFYDMLDQFEARYPDRYGELEEMMNTIQSAGDREEDVEIPDAAVDVDATFTEAEAAYTKLDQMQLSGATLEALDAAFVDIAKQADTAHTLYEKVYQNTDDGELHVKSLVRAADLYALVASRIRSMPEVEGVDAQALELAKTRNAEPLEKQATKLYAAAAAAADEKGVDNEFSKRAKQNMNGTAPAPAPTDGAEAPTEPGEGAPTEDGAGDEAAPE